MNADNTRLRVDLTDDLSAEQVETLIADLASLRSDMLPAVSMDGPNKMNGDNRFMEQERASLMINTLADGGIQIFLRNEGLGWLAFNLDAGMHAQLTDFFQHERGYGGGTKH